MEISPGYPVTYSVDPPAPQSRLTTLLRIILVIPHLIVLYLLGIAQGIVTLIAWFAILITGSYPAGMLRFSIGAMQWSARATGYVYLLTGKYPPFALGNGDAYPVRLHVVEMSSGRNRLTTFFRLLMVIPHIIVLYFLGIALSVVWLISWIVALFTGAVPAGLHNFIAGVVRWQTRANAYTLLLVDEYPPFALD